MHALQQHQNVNSQTKTNNNSNNFKNLLKTFLPTKEEKKNLMPQCLNVLLLKYARDSLWKAVIRKKHTNKICKSSVSFKTVMIISLNLNWNKTLLLIETFLIFCFLAFQMRSSVKRKRGAQKLSDRVKSQIFSMIFFSF